MNDRRIAITEHPLVSICMGVYNAQQFVSQAIESILQQDYPYFELIISDNGSQDRSGEICRDYAQKDQRIIYNRNETNINPLYNSTSMLERTTGTYHMWAADHDVYHSKFISSLLNVFNQVDDNVILAYTDACHIDINNKPMREVSEDIDTCEITAVEGFKKALWGLTYCTPIFGLYRSSAVKAVWKMRWIIGPDRVFLPELGLKGKFAHLKKTLFFWRQNRPVENPYELDQRQVKWFVPNKVEALAPSTMRDYELLKVVHASDLDSKEKEELYFEILRWHHVETGKKSVREARHIHHDGTKLLTSDAVSLEIKKEAAKDYFRVAQISKIFCKACGEQLDQLIKLCLQFIDGESNGVVEKIQIASDRIKPDCQESVLIPPEIINDEFYQDIRQLAAQEDIETILEVGSSAGEGSTSAFAAGIKAAGNEAKLYCMEVSKNRYDQLKKRYASEENIICYRASSTALDRFPSERDVIDFYQSTPTNLNQYPLGQVLGWLRQDKAYIEHAGNLGNGIQVIKRDHKIKDFDVVLIDGSEFTGGAEMEDVYGAKLILLDDINSYKNYHNYQSLKNDTNYRLEKENWKLRNGYAIFRKVEPKPLPIHFFTIVLNGEPFIRYHLDVFKKLDTPWHWHIIEGVADLKHDTSWSLAKGGKIPTKYHHKGISVDGTSTYLDQIAKELPDQITLYRKKSGAFWDGKLEMINAPLKNLPEHCLLWQVDADELWEAQQITAAHDLFQKYPERTAAHFRCHFFVGPDMVTTTQNTYSHNDSYEWIRLWRYQRGMQWQSHEPPKLMVKQNNGWTDAAFINPFVHQETEDAGLVFTHYAYALASQVEFKEDYYGYAGAVSQWQRLQCVDKFPARLSDYFGWVNDNTLVDNVKNRKIGIKVNPIGLKKILSKTLGEPILNSPRIVIDGVIFQHQAGRPQGISRVWSNMISGLRQQMPNAQITILQREGFKVPVDNVAIQTVPAFKWGDSTCLDQDDEMLRKTCTGLKADLFFSSYYTRAPGVRNLVMVHDLIPEKLGFDLTQPEWVVKKRAIETADAFICVSQTTRTDLLEVYPHVEKQPITVAYNGLDPSFRAPSPQAIEQLKHQLNIDGPYVLLVGNRHGYKNGEGGLKALSQIEGADKPIVICVGGETRLSPAESYLKDQHEVQFVGPLDDQALAAAYGGAQALIVPSQYEGFGLPVIEAMACGCPVIANVSSAVSEIGQDAVCFVDVNSTDDLQNALKMVSHPIQRETLIQKGERCVSKFDWSATAQVTGDFISKLIHQPTILLTAIVSTYNAERFIQGCLEDLVQQTIADRLEIIVVDSASQQDEAAVIRDFQARYSNIKYIRTPKRESVYQAWNRGIKIAVGKYVTNANTDDRHRHDAFELMVNALEADDRIALVYADVVKTRKANETFRVCTPTGYLRWPDWDRTELLSKGCFIGPQPVWRRRVHDQYGYFDEKYRTSADYEFWLRISQTNEFFHLPTALGLYMDRDDSIEHSNSQLKKREDNEIIATYADAQLQDRIIDLKPVVIANTDNSGKVTNPRQKIGQLAAHGDTAGIGSTQGDPNMQLQETLLKAVEHLVESDQKEAAYWAMDKMLLDYPENPQLHSQRATMAFEQRDMDKALHHYELAAEIAPQDAQILRNLGDFFYVVQKDSQKALTQYEKVLAIVPGDVETLLLAGHLSISLHHYEQARQYYQEVRRVEPGNDQVQPYLDKLKMQIAVPQDDKMSVEGLLAAAQAKVQADEKPAAIALLEQVLLRTPDHPLAHNDLGVLYYESGNMQKAKTHYEQASRLLPENEIFQKNLADFYWAELADPALAMSQYLQVLKLNPQDVDTMLSCAQICLATENVEDARDFMDTVLTLEPWNDDAKEMLKRLKGDAPAIGIETDNDDLYAQAKTKAACGDLKGAIKDLKQVMIDSPDEPKYHNELGVLYYESGEKEAALTSYECAVRLQPSEPNYAKNLADFYLLEKGRSEDAMKLYLGVLEENPEDVEALLATGMVCASIGNAPDASHFYHRVLEIEPWNQTAKDAVAGLKKQTEPAMNQEKNHAVAG